VQCCVLKSIYSVVSWKYNVASWTADISRNKRHYILNNQFISLVPSSNFDNYREYFHLPWWCEKLNQTVQNILGQREPDIIKTGLVGVRTPHKTVAWKELKCFFSSDRLKIYIFMSSDQVDPITQDKIWVSPKKWPSIFGF